MVGRRSPLHEDRQISWLQLDRPLWPTYCGHHAAENEVTYGAHNLEQHQVASSDFDTERNDVAYSVSNAQQKQLVNGAYTFCPRFVGQEHRAEVLPPLRPHLSVD
jgi:hypothetical protein